MADKLTQQIIDALTKAAAEQGGVLLYAGKSDPGMFSSTASGKSAAQKCLNDGFIQVVGSETRARTPRELYGLTEKGWEFLLAQVNPKQVLEDFVRILETRQGEVGELLETARQMAASLQGLKDAVTRVLPVVSAARIGGVELGTVNRTIAPLTPSGMLPVRTEAQPDVGVHAPGTNGRVFPENGSVALLDAPPVALAADLAAAILAHLRDWSGAAGEDCPLPELFRRLSVCDPPPTIGEFHDCLRRLQADGAIYLHPWGGPLYALPEPAYALLSGHSIAYYASVRQ